MPASKRLYNAVADTLRGQFRYIVEDFADNVDEGQSTVIAEERYATLRSVVNNLKSDFYRDNIRFDGQRFVDHIFGDSYVYGVWYGGMSYSYTMTYEDGMERWVSVQEAKESLRERLSGSDDFYYQKGHHAILEAHHVLTPAVDRESFIDLYHGKRNGLDLEISSEPYRRLRFGPRGGVREESF